jgi:hypothetical protein
VNAINDAHSSRGRTLHPAMCRVCRRAGGSAGKGRAGSRGGLGPSSSLLPEAVDALPVARLVPKRRPAAAVWPRGLDALNQRTVVGPALASRGLAAQQQQDRLQHGSLYDALMDDGLEGRLRGG